MALNSREWDEPRRPHFGGQTSKIVRTTRRAFPAAWLAEQVVSRGPRTRRCSPSAAWSNFEIVLQNRRSSVHWPLPSCISRPLFGAKFDRIIDTSMAGSAKRARSVVMKITRLEIDEP